MGPVKILSRGWMDRRAPVHSEDEEKREEKNNHENSVELRNGLFVGLQKYL
jgi:hypothetical protein